MEITSSSNSKFKYFKSLQTKKGRDESGEYIVEGIKSVYDALSSDCTVTAVIVGKSKSAELDDLPHDILYVVSDQLVGKLTDTKAPQGIFAVIKKKETGLELRSGGLYVFCDGISDPGNLGTIIRTADSAGFDGVLLSKGCVDVYNPKTVRSCMGSFFHIDIFTSVDYGKLCGAKIYGGILSGETVDYRTVDYSGCMVIAVGNEANGISEELKKKCIPIKIPIYGKAESLNVAVAASLMMYEAANKRVEENQK